MIDTIKTWIQSNIELILTILGFLLTLIELRRTKSAVEATKNATEGTIQLLTERTTISDIAVILISMRETQTALRGNRFEAALIRIQDLREKLFALRSRDGFKSDDRLQNIQEMVFALKKMQDSIESYLSAPEKYKIHVPRYNNQLAEFTGLLSSWREEVHNTKRSMTS